MGPVADGLVSDPSTSKFICERDGDVGRRFFREVTDVVLNGDIDNAMRESGAPREPAGGWAGGGGGGIPLQIWR